MANEASLREPPSLDAARKLLNNFAVDGFQSSDEQVLIRLAKAWCLSKWLLNQCILNVESLPGCKC